MRKTKKIIGILTIMSFAFMCVNCSKKNTGKSAETYTLTQGKQATSPFISPLVQIADEEGFFNEYNLKIETQIDNM